MNHYHEAAEFMSSHWGMIARVFVITVVQRFAMFAVTYFVYRAFMVIFKKVFGEALLIPGLILSRGLGYYSELFLSAIFTLVAVVVFQVREHKKSKVK